MEFFLGIDLGTSYFKAGIFDGNGNLKGLGRRFVEKDTGDGSVCELPVSEFWNTLHVCIEEAIQKAGIMPREIKAVSYSSQANSFILLDNNNNPLTPLILWPDRRAEETDFPLVNFVDEAEFIAKTGLGIRLSFEFMVAKINWFRNKQPELWKRVKSILSISDYLTFGLTGQKVSDMSTLSMTGLFDIQGFKLWDKALESLNLSQNLFPSPKRMGSLVGTLDEKGADLIGLPMGTSYYLGGLDHHCAAIGSGIVLNDNICESTGTVLSCVGSSSGFNPGKNYCTAPGLFNGQYFQMAFDNNGALSLEWYQKNFAGKYSIEKLLEMAQKVEKGCQGLYTRPCANNYPGLEGFVNIQPMHEHGHFVRALLESTAGSLASLINIIKGTGFSGKVISTGGGAQSHLWVQIKADRLNTVFCIPDCNETACLGAAMIGAASLKTRVDWHEFMKCWVRNKETIKPV